jgi:hypothetical protein
MAQRLIGCFASYAGALALPAELVYANCVLTACWLQRMYVLGESLSAHAQQLQRFARTQPDYPG